jgi:hypothetical protein
LTDAAGESFLEPAELAALRAEIERDGFRRDALVAEYADRRYCGLNITVEWPLPANIETTYRDFARELGAVSPALYVYPFATTHVTVLTAVNFKSNPDPDEARVRDVDLAAERLADFLDASAGDIDPFALEIGRPVLASSAAFLPIKNPTGEVARVRRRALDFCRQAGAPFESASAPRAVHSTVLRFVEAPRDPVAFAQRFDEIARNFTFASISVERLLVTLETKPYMRDGRVVRGVALHASAG